MLILWKQRPWTAKGYYKPKTKEGGGEERYAIREEQDKYKPRARDTSLWHLFRPPREKKREQHESKNAPRKNWHAKHTNLNRLMQQVKWQGWTMRQSPLFSLSAWMLWSSGETNGSDMFSDWKSFWSWTFGFGFQSDHIHWLLSRLLHVCSSFKYPGWVEKVELFRVGQKLLAAPCDRSGNFIHLTDRRGYEVELKFPCMSR